MNIDFKKLPSSQITQRDIANHLGIRQATVSRALSGHPDISEKTKRLILKTAETIGYKIENNDAARRLIARRHGNAPQNNVIALLIPGTLVQSPYYAKIIDGILSSLVPYGYILAISNQVTNKAAEINLLKIINRGLVDGVILIPNKDSEFINVLMKNQFSGNPLITIIMKDETESSLNIIADEENAAYIAARHLLELGHRHFLMFHLWGGTFHEHRRLSVIRALREYGLDPDKYFHKYQMPWNWMNPTMLMKQKSELHPQQISDAEEFANFIKNNPHITAIIALNDTCAIFARNSLENIGIKVPNDVSIVGHDDTEAMSDESGQNMLTTIRMPLFEIGQLTAKKMIEQLESRIIENTVIILPTELIIRSSTSNTRTK